MITASGIGSGLDVDGLVTQLVQAESEPTEFRLNSQEGFLSAELSAYGTLKSALATLQAATGRVRSASTFEQRSVQLSSTEAIDVTASSRAPIGSFNVEVTQLAESHSLVSGAFTSEDDVVGTGSLTIRFGTTDYAVGTDTYNGFALNEESSTFTLLLDSSNNSLSSVRDAINDADANVSAAIVDDGSGFRLLITGSEPGGENSLEISVVDDDANDTDATGLSALSFNAGAHHLEQTVAASDAVLTLNGLSITHGSNTVTGAVDGLTFNLKQTTSEAVSLSIRKDDSAIKSAINEVVNGFRAYNSVANQLSRFDESTSRGNILLGDGTLRTVSSRIRQVLTDPADNISATFRTLAEIGITTDINGNLQIDDAKLDQIIDENPGELARMFSVVGTIADEQISYAAASPATESGDYGITISQLATRGTFNGGSVLPDFDLGGTVVIDGTNDALTIALDGVAGGEFSLTHGTYASGASLAAEIQSRINAVEKFRDSGLSVDVNFDVTNNRLDIQSSSFGSSSEIEISAVDATTVTSLGFSVSAGTLGVDVAGTIDGFVAIGNGQVLTAGEGSGAEGLTLTVAGGALGVRPSISFVRGLGDKLDSALTTLLASDGLIDARTSGINDSIEQIQEDREAHLLRMETIEARYRAQFGALDTLIAQLQSTGNFLTSALASLPGTSRN